MRLVSKTFITMQDTFNAQPLREAHMSFAKIAATFLRLQRVRAWLFT